MNLISCENCGVVLDLKRIIFDEDIYDEEGDVIQSKAIWNGSRWVPFFPCPVCKDEIEHPDWRDW